VIEKTILGIEAFDSILGGLYRGRSAVCTGRHGSGKTILALQSMAAAVAGGEKPLMLTSWQARDLVIIAQNAVGFQLDEALGGGRAVLMEYAGMETQQGEPDITLPPGSFTELVHVVEERGIKHVIFDTVLPWVAIPAEDRLSKHVYSFVQALDRMGVTSLLTIPRPVSMRAVKLLDLLRDQVPVVISLESGSDPSQRMLTVSKYLGESSLPPPIKLKLGDGQGLVSEGRESRNPMLRHDGKNSAKAGIRFASAFNSNSKGPA
jgi:KaiC/GvpD/RAD55 family RecA-like ATPase